MRSSRWFKSQTVRAETRIISYSTDMYWRLQAILITKCRKIVSMIIGTSMDQGICHIFLDSSHTIYFIKKKNLQTDTCGAEDDKRNGK